MQDEALGYSANQSVQKHSTQQQASDGAVLHKDLHHTILGSQGLFGSRAGG
jgi:hypothetical protein